MCSDYAYCKWYDRPFSWPTLFVKHTLYVLYKFVGEEKYMNFIALYKGLSSFSANCDLEKINKLLVEYGEKEYAQDDPDILIPLLISFLK